MVNRRDFLLNIAGASAAVVTAPAAVLAVVPKPSSAEPNNDTLITRPELPEVIVELEKYLANHPDTFSWDVHNELRHHYLAFDEAKSRHHADIILKHSFMDDYILNTLSHWHIYYGNPHDGIMSLRWMSHQFNHRVHLHAACLVRAGQEYHTYTMYPEANTLLNQVLGHGRAAQMMMATLRPYYALAQRLLTF
jgi:hypothetical protein